MSSSQSTATLNWNSLFKNVLNILHLHNFLKQLVLKGFGGGGGGGDFDIENKMLNFIFGNVSRLRRLRSDLLNPKFGSQKSTIL